MSALLSNPVAPGYLDSPGPQDARTPPLFPDRMLEVAVTTRRRTNRRVRSRTRDPLLPFPDRDDTQLSLFDRLNDETLVQEMMRYCDETIEQALKVLVDRRFNATDRRRVLEWIAVPIVPPGELVEKFSFQGLCLMAGITEPEVIRQEVLERFAPERLAASSRRAARR